MYGCPKIPANIQLRDYQKQAVKSWFDNRGRGTLKMATGSGKTIAALAIVSELSQKISLQALLIVCPYRHLVSQWARECEKFGLVPILAFEKIKRWQSKLSTQLYNLKLGNQPFLTVITTNATLTGEGLQSQLGYFPEKTLIIGDEVHNLGSPKLEESLPRNIGLRLGLSATPERHFDEVGTEALTRYFGKVLSPELTLADAIKKGALVSYRYYPVLVNLTEEESQTYARLTTRIGWSLSAGEDINNSEELKPLLMQRARLIGSAANKLQALREVMRSRLNTSHTLFYCGDGSVEEETTTEHISSDCADGFVEEETTPASYRQLEAAARILGVELGYRVNTYTAKTPLEEREKLRQLFECGELQGLVAIRCLDEGVDIPAIQNAVILASSSNPRQFIQRRGRVLRPHANKKCATLFDMIVIPPELDRQTWDVERNLLRKELKRFVEFANLADNAEEAKKKLLSVQERYSLLEVED